MHHSVGTIARLPIQYQRMRALSVCVFFLSALESADHIANKLCSSFLKSSLHWNITPKFGWIASLVCTIIRWSLDTNETNVFELLVLSSKLLCETMLSVEMMTPKEMSHPNNRIHRWIYAHMNVVTFQHVTHWSAGEWEGTGNVEQMWRIYDFKNTKTKYW